MFRGKRVLLLGSKGVGKSTLTHGERSVSEFKHKTGMSVMNIFYQIPGMSIALDLWEVDFELYDEIMPKFKPAGTRGVVFVFDVTSRDSFLSIEQYVGDCLSRLDNALVMVVANKTDQADQREVSTEEATEYAVSKGFDYVESELQDRTSFEDAMKKFASKL